MKKLFPIAAIIFLVISIIFIYYLAVYQPTKEKARLEQEEKIRQACEQEYLDCYFDRVGETLDEEGKADFDLIIKLTEECKTTCLKKYGLE